MGNRLSADDRRQIAVLFRAEAPGLFAFALSLGRSREEADDLVQTVFHAAVRQWGEVVRRDGEGRRRWLFRVLRNKAVDAWRADRARREFWQRWADTPEPHPAGVEQEVVYLMALERCWSTIAAMPPTRQRVAFLKWGEEWPTRDIADLLGIEQATVRGHVKEARDELAVKVGPMIPFVQTDEDGEEVERPDVR